MKIMLDPGHGGIDSGAVGHGYAEKDLTLEAALYIGKRLEELGAEVSYTRTTDVFAGQVDERGRSAKGCDYLLSIHCNALSDTATGAEVWCQGGETFAQTESRFADYLSPLLRWRGVKSKNYVTGEQIMRPYDDKRRFVETYSFTDWYGVLRGAAQVGVSADLLEMFFISNKSDLDIYLSHKTEFWEGITRAICESFGIAYKAPSASQDTPDWHRMYTDLLQRYRTLEAKHDTLVVEHNTLEAEHNATLKDINELHQKHWTV